MCASEGSHLAFKMLLLVRMNLSIRSSCLGSVVKFLRGSQTAEAQSRWRVAALSGFAVSEVPLLSLELFLSAVRVLDVAVDVDVDVEVAVVAVAVEVEVE